MATLEIDGIGKVEVDNRFLQLTPQQQAAEVDAIAAQIKGTTPAAPPVNGVPVSGGGTLEPAVPLPETRGVIERTTEGAKAAFGDRPLGISPETRQQYPATGVLQPLAAPADLVLRGISAALGGGAGAVAGLAEAAGFSRSEADRLERDLNVVAKVGFAQAPGVSTRPQVSATTPARAPGATKRSAAIEERFETAAARVQKEAEPYYKQVDESGAKVAPERIVSFGDEVKDGTLKGKFGDRRGPLYHPKLHDNVKVAAEEVEGLAARASKGEAIGISELANTRRVIGAAERKAAKGEAKSDELALLGEMKRKVDDLIGELPAVGEAHKTATALWARSAKLETIANMVDRAITTAGPTTGARAFEGALINEFKSLAKSKDLRGFSAEEQKLIKLVARGGAGEKVARHVGKLDPANAMSGFLSGTMGATVGSALLGPGLGSFAGAATFMGVGKAGKRVAAALMSRNLHELETAISGGVKSRMATEAASRAKEILRKLETPAAATAITTSQRERERKSSSSSR